MRLDLYDLMELAALYALAPCRPGGRGPRVSTRRRGPFSRRRTDVHEPVILALAEGLKPVMPAPATRRELLAQVTGL